MVRTSLTLEANPYIRRHIQGYYGGVLAEESKAIFMKYDPGALQYILTGKARSFSLDGSPQLPG